MNFLCCDSIVNRDYPDSWRRLRFFDTEVLRHLRMSLHPHQNWALDTFVMNLYNTTTLMSAVAGHELKIRNSRGSISAEHIEHPHTVLFTKFLKAFVAQIRLKSRVKSQIICTMSKMSSGWFYLVPFVVSLLRYHTYTVKAMLSKIIFTDDERSPIKSWYLRRDSKTLISSVVAFCNPIFDEMTTCI